MIATFGSAVFQFGLPIIQMAAQLSLVELQKIKVNFPGIDFILKNQISPVFKTEKNIKYLEKV